MEVDVMKVGDKLEKEKEEMNMLDAIFDKKTKKLAHLIQIQQEEGGEEKVMSKELVEGVGWKERKKITIGKRNFVVADKISARIADETTNVLEKAQNRVEATFEGKNSFSILNSFSSQIFVNVASHVALIWVLMRRKN
jgi:hypothetical protein